MKRLTALLMAAVLMAALLCGCMQEAKSDMKSAASEFVNSLQGNNATEVKDRDLPLPTESDAENMSPTEDDSVMDQIATEMQDMVENGEVSDGDGNVGELENGDGDANIDEEAAENAQARVSADSYPDDNE